MITIETLLADKQQIEESLLTWRNQLTEAQIQIHVHTGHLERINMMINQLQQNKTDSAETSDKPTL